MGNEKPITMSVLDRMIAAVSPGRAVARMQAKRALALSMNYDAASRGRRTSGWRAPASSADAAGGAGGARAQLRQLARDFVRNRPFAARGLQVITGNVVGSGITPSIQAANDARTREVMGVLRQHLWSTAIDAAGLHTLFSLQRVAMNGVVEDGEVLLRRRWRDGFYGRSLALPFQIETLEPDHLDPWKTSNGQNEVIEGVEYGPTGAIVAYHVFPQHPGALAWRRRLESVRIPASEIIHVRRADRPGQMRGVSWFAPVIMRLGDLDDYHEGELLKQKIAALLAGFITSTDGEPEVAAVTPEDAADELGLGEIGPGTLTELPDGKSITFTTPPKVDSFDSFTRQNLAAVAMGLGVTYESLAGDLSNVNYSSARMGRIEMDRNIELWQSQVMIDQLCRGVERWIAEAWLMRPELGPLDFALEWTAPRRPLINPEREIPAIISEIDAGLTSRQRAVRQLGRDPDLIHAERLEDAARDGTPPSLPET